MSFKKRAAIEQDLPETRDRNDAVLEVGARVRSFDFPDVARELEGERACYVEGVVEGVCRDFPDCPRYAIKVDRQVFAGKETDHLVGEHVFPPLNGTPTWLGGTTDAVEKA
jgi:hypothetical protein